MLRRRFDTSRCRAAALFFYLNDDPPHQKQADELCEVQPNRAWLPGLRLATTGNISNTCNAEAVPDCREAAKSRRNLSRPCGTNSCICTARSHLGSYESTSAGSSLTVAPCSTAAVIATTTATAVA